MKTRQDSCDLSFEGKKNQEIVLGICFHAFTDVEYTSGYFLQLAIVIYLCPSLEKCAFATCFLSTKCGLSLYYALTDVTPLNTQSISCCMH